MIQHEIKELKVRKEEFEDEIEQFKIIMKSLLQVFKNSTIKDNCNGVLDPLSRSYQEIKAICPSSSSGH